MITMEHYFVHVTPIPVKPVPWTQISMIQKQIAMWYLDLQNLQDFYLITSCFVFLALCCDPKLI